MQDMIGRMLGHFRLVEQIGAGGMGRVYRAHDEHLERDVAVKVLPADTFSDEGARARFRKEALALAKLSHPNIAHVHDFASQDGVDFLVMELVQGRSLADRPAGSGVAEAETLRLGIQLASALEEAHRAGIVHRDLKPGNLMVTTRGELKVLDFGLAKLVRQPTENESTQAASEAAGVAGTAPYMAPEQLRAQPVDARTDIWGAGAVLYELVTGKRAFPEAARGTLADAILNRPPASPSSLNRTISPGFERIVQKCLEKDPNRRYQSARELKVDLDRLANPTTPALATATRRRPARWWLGAAAGVLVVGALVVLKPWRSSRISLPGVAPIASLAVLPLANMTGDAGQEYFSDGMTEALITELSRIRALKVISRTSVMRFKKSDKALPEIAKQLGVEAIVEGSVARSGGRVRVTAQLIHAASDQHLWADTFDRQESDVLALQGEVARAIASQVCAAVTPDEERRLARIRKVNPEAYDLILQGFHLVKSGGDPDAMHRAIALFEKAIALDPQSAQAHAGLANALATLASYGFASFREISARVASELDVTLALDPDYVWAYVARGDLLARQDPHRALQAYLRAVQLDPGNSIALYDYAYMLDLLEPGADGERLLRKAVEMDPLAQAPRCGLMGRLYVKRRYEESEAEARRILDFDPNWFWAWDQLWRIHVRQGRVAEAQEESRRAWAVVFGDAFKPPPGLSWEAYERWLDRFLADQPRTWKTGFLAASFARRGETQKALAYLEETDKENNAWMGQLDYPDFDPIREEPRFRRIVQSRDLPVAGFCSIPRTRGSS